MPISSQSTCSSYFVTGTDTETGKTLVAAALTHAMVRRGLMVAAMKPVAAGTEIINGCRCNEDVETLRAHANVQSSLECVVPYLFDLPIAPHIAAARQGITMSSARIFSAFDQLRAASDAVVVEGAGGFCVPISETEDLADVAQGLGLPVMLVVGMRLGCISHAVLTAQAITARGLAIAGWVANTVDPDMPFLQENIQTLKRRLSAPYLGHIPRLDVPDPAIAASFLDFARLSGWLDHPVMK